MTSMKQPILFLLKVAIVAVVCVGILMAASAVYAQVRITEDVPDGITIANTGSSHGHRGFNWSWINSDASNATSTSDATSTTNATNSTQEVAYNFADSGQSLNYDWRLVDYNIDKFADGAVLFIPVSYFSFWGEETLEQTFESSNVRYYSRLDVDHILFANKTTEFQQRYFSLLYMVDNSLRTIVKPASTENAEVEVEDPDNPQPSEGFTREEIGKRRSEFFLSYLEKPDGTVNPMNDARMNSLNSLIELCLTNNIRPILVTTPLMDVFSKHFDETFLGAFYNYMDGLVEKYNVEYWDYSHDDRFAYSPELFRDTDHLDVDGAILFSKIVAQRAGFEVEF